MEIIEITKEEIAKVEDIVEIIEKTIEKTPKIAVVIEKGIKFEKSKEIYKYNKRTLNSLKGFFFFLFFFLH